MDEKRRKECSIRRHHGQLRRCRNMPTGVILHPEHNYEQKLNEEQIGMHRDYRLFKNTNDS